MLSRTLRGLAVAGLLAASVSAAEFKPDVRYATIAFDGLRVHVPAAEAESLRPLAARAAAIYARLKADAGYAPDDTLHLVLTDDEDGHNGFSTVIPLSLINVQFGPARPESTIFAGDDETARTLVHELAHHLSNDRNHGWRAGFERVFGRVLPNDPLSLGVFLLSTPNHVLSPAFWHEGLAQWAETTYADPTSAWRGRGRDSLTHMVWRLDAAQGAIPLADDWRLSYVRWPYGNRAYLYGLAYTRWLSGAFGDRRGLWRIVDDQGRLGLPFAFVNGSRTSLGFDHTELIARARTALLAEEQSALATIRAQSVTAVPRLTSAGWRVAAPAWADGSTLRYAADSPTGRPAIRELSADGRDLGSPTLLTDEAWSMDGLRRVADGVTVRADAPVGGDIWQRSRVRISGRDDIRIPGERLIQPDARSAGAAWDVAAIQLLPVGQQALVVARGASATAADWHAVPSEGRAWSPAFRPGSDQLCWVESDHAGSRLVVAGLDGSGRTVLWQVAGRIMHPVWSSDGSRIFCASDVSGVANGWCVDLAGVAKPVTNVIGGVLAVVPSPDGSQLAVLDHDQNGPFLGVIPADPSLWPAAVPQVALAWPAPVERQPLGTDATGTDSPDPVGPVPTAGAEPPPAVPYSGLGELRLRFWTPTTMAVPEGGLGVVTMATDALLTHTVIASAGRGLYEGAPVGVFAWTYAGWSPALAFIAKRSELGYDQQVAASDGRLYDYTETVDTIEGRVGIGLGGAGRRWQAWLAAGLDRHQPVSAATDRYAGLTTFAPDPFVGTERYVEADVAYDDSILYPTSYAREEGLELALSARASTPRGNRLLGQASYSQPVWAEGGHQLVGAAQIGWSDGPHDLQGRFGIGGNQAQGVPRGYPEVLIRGRCLEAYSLAYRLPLLRPFAGAGTTPWSTRQVVVEGFYDVARVGDQLGDGDWIRSAGAELHLDLEFWSVRLAPGIGWARQIDALEEDAGYITLGFRW